MVSINNPELILKHLGEIDLNRSLIYMAGSLMEGFGNGTSDIDVYIICDQIKVNDNAQNGELLLTNNKSLIRNIIHEDVRYDFEYWLWDDFLDMIKKLNNLNFNTDGYVERISNDEFDLLHRLKFGKPLVNKEKFFGIYNNVKFENLGYYKAVVQSEIYSGYIEDLQGAYTSKDFGSAFIMARRLVEHVVNSLLALEGETNPSAKWIYRKLLRYQEHSGDKDLMEKYFYFITYPFDEKTIKKFIQEAIKYCQNINMKIQNILYEKQLDQTY